MGLIKGKQIDADTVTSVQVDTTNGGISTINGGDIAVEGAGTGLSRRDHQHAVATGGGTAGIDVGDAAAEGTSANLAREDHQHALPAPAAPANVSKAAAAAGASTTVARADHKHDVDTAAAVEISDATNSEGAATSLARSDHGHAHGNRGGGTLHSVATGGSPGFMSAADKLKLDALVDPLLLDPKDGVRLLELAGNVAPLSGATLVDGVAPAPGDRVAIFGQTTPAEDGIYIAAAGAWTRSADFATASGQAGAVFSVSEGTLNDNTFWQVTNDEGSDVVGTDDLLLLQVGAGDHRGAGDGLVLNVNDLDVVANADGSITVNPNDIQVGILATDAQHGARGGGTQHALAIAAGAAGFLSGADKTKLDSVTAGAQPTPTDYQETVTSQLITNADVILTDILNNIPLFSAASLTLYLNGVGQRQGAGLDYTVNPTTGAITWLASSGTAVNMQTNDDLWAKYKS